MARQSLLKQPGTTVAPVKRLKNKNAKVCMPDLATEAKEPSPPLPLPSSSSLDRRISRPRFLAILFLFIIVLVTLFLLGRSATSQSPPSLRRAFPARENANSDGSMRQSDDDGSYSSSFVSISPPISSSSPSPSPPRLYATSASRWSARGCQRSLSQSFVDAVCNVSIVSGYLLHSQSWCQSQCGFFWTGDFLIGDEDVHVGTSTSDGGDVGSIASSLNRATKDSMSTQAGHHPESSDSSRNRLSIMSAPPVASLEVNSGNNSDPNPSETDVMATSSAIAANFNRNSHRSPASLRRTFGLLRASRTYGELDSDAKAASNDVSCGSIDFYNSPITTHEFEMVLRTGGSNRNRHGRGISSHVQNSPPAGHHHGTTPLNTTTSSNFGKADIASTTSVADEEEASPPPNDEVVISGGRGGIGTILQKAFAHLWSAIGGGATAHGEASNNNNNDDDNHIVHLHSDDGQHASETAFGRETPHQRAIDFALRHPMANTVLLGQRRGGEDSSSASASSAAATTDTAVLREHLRHQKAIIRLDPLLALVPPVTVSVGQSTEAQPPTASISGPLSASSQTSHSLSSRELKGKLRHAPAPRLSSKKCSPRASPTAFSTTPHKYSHNDDGGNKRGDNSKVYVDRMGRAERTTTSSPRRGSRGSHRSSKGAFEYMSAHEMTAVLHHHAWEGIAVDDSQKETSSATSPSTSPPSPVAGRGIVMSGDSMVRQLFWSMVTNLRKDTNKRRRRMRNLDGKLNQNETDENEDDDDDGGVETVELQAQQDVVYIAYPDRDVYTPLVNGQFKADHCQMLQRWFGVGRYAEETETESEEGTAESHTLNTTPPPPVGGRPEGEGSKSAQSTSSTTTVAEDIFGRVMAQRLFEVETFAKKKSSGSGKKKNAGGAAKRTGQTVCPPPPPGQRDDAPEQPLFILLFLWDPVPNYVSRQLPNRVEPLYFTRSRLHIGGFVYWWADAPTGAAEAFRGPVNVSLGPYLAAMDRTLERYSSSGRPHRSTIAVGGGANAKSLSSTSTPPDTVATTVGPSSASTTATATSTAIQTVRKKYIWVTTPFSAVVPPTAPRMGHVPTRNARLRRWILADGRSSEAAVAGAKRNTPTAAAIVDYDSPLDPFTEADSDRQQWLGPHPEEAWLPLHLDGQYQQQYQQHPSAAAASSSNSSAASSSPSPPPSSSSSFREGLLRNITAIRRASTVMPLRLLQHWRSMTRLQNRRQARLAKLEEKKEGREAAQRGARISSQRQQPQRQRYLLDLAGIADVGQYASSPLLRVNPRIDGYHFQCGWRVGGEGGGAVNSGVIDQIWPNGYNCKDPFNTAAVQWLMGMLLAMD